jgi:hypothetical protein
MSRALVVALALLATALVAAAEYRPAANLWALTGPATPPLDSPGAGGSEGARDWTFDPNVRVHPAEGGEHLWPDIAVAEDGTLGVAWMDDHAAGGYHIFYSFSLDFGLTWSPPERVDDRATGAYSKFVSLAFTPLGTALAVWEDDRGGQINLYFSRRTGAPGQPWAPNLRINTAGSPPGGGDFMNGSLAVLDEQRWFVAWTDWREGPFYQVYARCTRDGGVTWGPERRVSDGLGYQPVAGDPCLVVDPNETDPGHEALYCVTNDWRGYAPQGRYPNVYFYRSADGGATWTVGVQVNDVEPYYQQTSSHALVELYDGALVAGWLNNPDFGLNHVRVSRSTDQGASWAPSAPVDEPLPGGTGTYPAIATDGDYVYAAHDGYVADWNVFFRASPDGGASWPYPSRRIDDDATGAATGNPVLAAPRLATIPGARTLEVYAAWQDNRAPGYNWKIYFTRGVDAGQGVPEAGGVARPVALRVAPNPSRAGTAVALRAPAGGGVAILDAAGRVVLALPLAAGGATWDGRDASGRSVPAGRYWIRAAGAARGVPLVRLR